MKASEHGLHSSMRRENGLTKTLSGLQSELNESEALPDDHTHETRIRSPQNQLDLVS